MAQNRPVAIGVAVAGGIVAAFLVIGALLAWGGHKAANDEAKDQAFLSLTVYNDTLSRADVTTRMELGHQMCSLLDRYDGDTARADASMARGYERTFTPSVLSALRLAATTTYCHQWYQRP